MRLRIAAIVSRCSAYLFLLSSSDRLIFFQNGCEVLLDLFKIFLWYHLLLCPRRLVFCFPLIYKYHSKNLKSENQAESRRRNS